MPLAGKMKLKHFIIILIAVIGLPIVAFGGCFSYLVITSEPTSDPEKTADPVAQATGEDYKTVVASYAGTSISETSQKDVRSGASYKINIYQDAGNKTINRAKVDLDRDNKWDEKWTFKSDGTISRKVSRADNELYDIEQKWSGSEWK